MARISQYDINTAPPHSVKQTFKHYQKLSPEQLRQDLNIIDTHDVSKSVATGTLEFGSTITRKNMYNACKSLNATFGLADSHDIQEYRIVGIPGLHIVPRLLPEAIQVDLLSNLMHDHLADPRNQTNVHAHHDVPYSAVQSDSLDTAGCSFFNTPQIEGVLFEPHDGNVHKSFTVQEFLSSKLRWMTLGHQYNWTLKKYPQKEGFPPFPAKIANFTQHIFSDLRAEAGIMNVYNPGDRLSLHRDISELCDHPLISLSIGCDAIFIAGLLIGKDIEPRMVALRLHSGDCVYLSGPARFAWHGVPQVLANTCPAWLHDWPSQQSAAHNEYQKFAAGWSGWARNKRINLSIRQVYQ